jgi:hypothetical protein
MEEHHAPLQTRVTLRRLVGKHEGPALVALDGVVDGPVDAAGPPHEGIHQGRQRLGVSLSAEPDQQRQQRDDASIVEGLVDARRQVVIVDDEAAVGDSVGVVDGDDQGLALQRVERLIHRGRQIGERLGAGRVTGAALDQDREGALQLGEANVAWDARWIDRVEDHAAHALGVVAQDREGELGSVRDPEQVPALEAQRTAQVRHVCSAGVAVPGCQVEAVASQLIAAGQGRFGARLQARFGAGVAGQDPEVLQAQIGTQHRLRMAHAALVQKQQVALLEQRVVEPAVPVIGGAAARAAVQVEHRIGCGLRSAAVEAHHGQAERAPVGALAAFRNDQEAAGHHVGRHLGGALHGAGCRLEAR